MSSTNNATGHPGTTLAPLPRFRLSTVALKRIALAKLADITMISADFSSETVVFEPWISLLIDAGTKALFTGVYRPSFPLDDEAQPGLPDLCWRRSEWIREIDESQVGEASDRAAYLSGDTQITSTIQFTTLTQQPNLAAFIQRTIAQFTTGFAMAATRRPDAPWHQLTLAIADLGLQIDYSPLLAQSAIVEAWLPDWLTVINTIDTAHAVQPDDEITLSYRRSLPELLAAAHRT